jgi:hypothetical protein
VGAGSGYWSWELRQAGVDCVATDPGIGRYCHVNEGQENWPVKFCEVERLTAREALEKYPTRALLTVWPDYEESWTDEALRAYGGTTVVYVGEGAGGCTGTDEFHRILADEWDELESAHMPQFWGIHDYLTIYKRRIK